MQQKEKIDTIEDADSVLISWLNFAFEIAYYRLIQKQHFDTENFQNNRGDAILE